MKIMDIKQVISREFLEMKLNDSSWQLLTENLKSGKLSQNELLELTVNYPSAKIYPPSIKFIKSFLKNLINKLEHLDIEVNEEIYQVFFDYLNKDEKNQDNYYRIYTIKGLQIIIRETSNLVVSGTTGMTIWLASTVLAEFCISKNLYSLEVLELGSGLGLTGISVIKNNKPRSFTFTDHHPSVLESIRHNMIINFPEADKINTEKENIDHYKWNESDVMIRSLDWEDPITVPQSDVILAADVLFDPKLIPALLNTIKMAMKSINSKAYVAATVRNEETIALFLSEIEKLGLSIERIEERTPKCSKFQYTVQIYSIINAVTKENIR